MAPKHHPTPLSGGDRKALSKELTKARAMTGILSARADEARRAGEALIREADDLLCQSWNERMWADGGPIDPSPTVDQAVNGGYPWLEIRCSRCRTPRSVDLAGLRHVEITCVHDLARRLRCAKCREAGKRPAAELLQLGKGERGERLPSQQPNSMMRCVCGTVFDSHRPEESLPHRRHLYAKATRP